MRIVTYLAGVLPALSPAAEIPKPAVPEGVGVNMHFCTGDCLDRAGCTPVPRACQFVSAGVAFDLMRTQTTGLFVLRPAF